MITDALFAFMNDLAANNSRTWFAENKVRYQKDVQGPFLEFVGVLIDRIREFEPGISQTAKEAVFRLHRDTRFSKDKSPYKTQLAAVVSLGGRKAMGYPGFYIEVGASGCHIGGGSYLPEREHIANVRELIAEHSEEFLLLANDPIFRKLYGQVLGDKNKILPVEYRDLVATVPLIANKQWYWMIQVPNKKVVGAKGIETALEYYRAARPLQEFLRRSFDGI